MSTTTQLEPVEASNSYGMADLDTKPPSNSDPNASENPAPEEPKLNRDAVVKLVAVAFSFFMSGVNDGSIGPLIPYIIREYSLTTAIVSVVYGANFAGWLLAAITNTHLTQFFGLGGLLTFGALFQVIAHALRSWNPPFPFFAVTFWLVCLGQGYQDTGGNTYAAGAKGAHRWLAFIHAMYMAGNLVAPFVATPIASAGETSRWYLFYTFPVGLGVINTAMTGFAFRDSINFGRKQFPGGSRDAVESSANAGEDEEAPKKSAFDLMKSALASPGTWLVSLFFFFFLGAAITASGWVVEYLVEVRGGNLAQMGYVPAGFNGGAMLGRLLLAEPTYRLGERRMVCLYVVLCIGFQLIFWLVPNVIAASIAVSIVGFFSGPFFATGISVASKLFSPEVQSTALSFVFVFGQIGGSLFPVITGVIASSVGVHVLQPILVALFVGTGVSWLLIPKPKNANNMALHQE